MEYRRRACSHGVWLTRDIRYTKAHKFNQIERNFGVAVKQRNTIIDKWPARLKLRPGQQGATEEFKGLLASGSTGSERYVEWKKTV